MILKIEIKNEYIYSKLDKSLSAIDWDSLVVVMGDLNGHVGFLGKQGRKYNGELLMELAEKWR